MQRMSSITFDTLKFAKTLEEAGFDQKQAEALLSAYKDANSEAKLATGDDIERLQIKIEAEFKLLKWMVGLSLAVSAGIFSILARLFFALPH